MLGHTSTVEHVVFIVVACVALVAYGIAWLSTPKRSFVRLGCWTSGLSVLAAATAPTVEGWAEASFTGHMVQHLLMIVIAAPLLVLSRPVTTAMTSWSPQWLRSTMHRRASSWWRSAGPVVAPGLFLATLYVTHLTGIYDATLGNRLVHDLEHVAYLTTAVALWAVVTAGGRMAAPHRVGAVFGVIGGSALLGVVLLSATTPLVPTYARELGLDVALDDQRTAASLMWVGGMAITLPMLISSVWRWASAEERIAQRSEAASDRQASPPRSCY